MAWMELWVGAWLGPCDPVVCPSVLQLPQRDTASVGWEFSIGPANWDDLGPKLQGDHLLQKQDRQKSKASFPKLHSQWKSSHGCPASGRA